MEILFSALHRTLRQARTRPLRALLTVLEVALGALALTLALGVVHASTTERPLFAVIGAHQEGPRVNLYPLFLSSDLDRLRALSPAAKAMTLVRRPPGGQLDVSGVRYRTVGGLEVGNGYDQVFPLTMVQGTYFRSSDLQPGGRAMVVSRALSRALFGTTPALGKTIGVADDQGRAFEAYRVIGVAETLSEVPGVQAPAFLIPQRAASTYVYGNRMDRLIVRARPGQTGAVRDQVISAVRDVYRSDQGFLRQHQGLAMPDGRRNSLTDGPNLSALLFLALATVMLSVSSIGIFSSQLVSALERVRETGLRRALGASRYVVLTEGLIESAALAATGALVGVLGAWALTPSIRVLGGVSLFPDGLDFSWPWAALVWAALVGLGALLGLYPAWAASRLTPVQALRETSG